MGYLDHKLMEHRLGLMWTPTGMRADRRVEADAARLIGLRRAMVKQMFARLKLGSKAKAGQAAELGRREWAGEIRCGLSYLAPAKIGVPVRPKRLPGRAASVRKAWWSLPEARNKRLS